MNSILAFGYHDQSAPRHWNLKKMYEREGFQVVECPTTARGFFGKYRDLIRKFRTLTQDADAVLVTFPGQYLMPLAWWLTRKPRKKLIFDAFISLYDSLVDDRRTVSRWSPKALFLFYVDSMSCRLADEVLVDTETHKLFFIHRLHVDPERITVHYLGTRDDLFFPRPKTVAARDRFEVLFYGTYIPLQGIEYILGAARQLEEYPDIHFTLIGSGQTYKEMREMGRHIENITWKERVPYRELPDLMRGADVCLGIFGLTRKAMRVIPHKVYDAVACGIPVITMNSPAIHEKYKEWKDVHLVLAGDAENLAMKILELRNELPRSKLTGYHPASRAAD